MAGQEITPPPDSEIPPPPDYQPAQSGEGDKAKTPTTAEGIQGSIFGAGQPKELDTIQQIGNAVLPPLVTMPAAIAATGGGGALAAKALPKMPGLAAAGGRIATSGALGAGEAAVKGENPLGAGLQNAGIAAVWEGILGAAPYLPKGGLAKVAAGLAGREHEYQRAKDSVMQAYNKLKAFVPKGYLLDVPTISKKPISFLQASHGLEKLERAEFDAARAEIAAALKKAPHITSTPPLNPPVKASVALKNTAMQHPDLSGGFLTRTSTTPFKPSATGFERAATNIVGTMRDPAVRAGVDVLAGEGPDEMPLGLLPLAAGESGLKAVARRILR